MAANDSDKIQDLQMRLGALRFALDDCLSELAACYGTDARQKSRYFVMI